MAKYNPGRADNGMRVLVQNGNFDQALRKFKKKIADSGKLDALREREFYTKPTTKKTKAQAAAKARWKKHLRSQQLPPKLY
jgi:small subunit ribosomal protein S21